MNTHFVPSRRTVLKSGGALVVSFSFAGPIAQALAQGSAPPKPVTLTEVDSFLAIDAKGMVTVYSGKIDYGTGVRTAMIGTIRQLGNKRRISFRLLDVNTGETLLARTVSINTATPPALEMAHVYAKELFSMLAGARLEGAPVDPAMGDSAAHEFLRAGDELATHRTVVDIDRAITCYSRAIELQPKSAIARASFVLAAVGRLGLGYPDMELLRKAEVYGREAVALNGGSSFSHRALESPCYYRAS